MKLTSNVVLNLNEISEFNDNLKNFLHENNNEEEIKLSKGVNKNSNNENKNEKINSINVNQESKIINYFKVKLLF